MAFTLNRVTLFGEVTADPIDKGKFVIFYLKTTQSVYSLDLKKYIESDDIHTVMVKKDKLISVVNQYVKEKSRVIVEGYITYKISTNEEGKKVQTAYISVGPTEGSILLAGQAADPNKKQSYQKNKSYGSNSFDIDDEIPF